MTPQQQALAQLQHWNDNGYNPSQSVSWGTVAAPKYAQAPVKKKGGRGGFLSSLISEAGGGLGAAGGAALGTALLPGVGTLIGAGLGGFLGGTGGRVVENEVRDSRVGLGDALKEGALSGVLSGAGEGYQALKGAGSLATGAEDAGKVTKLANGLRSEVANPKVAASPFGASQEKSIVKALQDSGLKGSAKTQYENLPKVMSTLGNKIDVALAQNEGKTTTTKLLSTINTAAKDLPQFVGSDTAYKKSLSTELEDLASKFSGKTLSAGDIQAAKTDLSGKMGSIFTKLQKGADLNPKEASRLAIWKGLDTHIQSVAPEVKALTAQQSKLYEAAPGLLKNANKTAGIPLLGLKSQGVERGIQGAQDLAGRSLGVVGRLADNAIGKQAIRQAPAGLARALSGQASQNTQELDPTSSSLPLGYSAPQSQTPAQSPYSQENLLQDIQRDPKNTSQYVSLFKTLNDATKASQTSSQPSDDQSNILTALSALDSSESNLVGSGGAKGPGLGELATIPNLGQLLNTPGAAFHNTRIETATQLAKALTGNSRPASQVIQQYLHSLPDVTDTPATAQKKLQLLRMDILKRAQATGLDISGYTNSTLPGPQPSPDLQQVLMSLGAQGGY